MISTYLLTPSTEFSGVGQFDYGRSWTSGRCSDTSHALITIVRTLPNELNFSTNFAVASSLGASSRWTKSYGPKVIHAGFRSTPNFFALSRDWSRLFGISLMVLAPWSVRFNSTIYFGI